MRLSESLLYIPPSSLANIGIVPPKERQYIQGESALVMLAAELRRDKVFQMNQSQQMGFSFLCQTVIHHIWVRHVVSRRGFVKVHAFVAVDFGTHCEGGAVTLTL